MSDGERSNGEADYSSTQTGGGRPAHGHPVEWLRTRAIGSTTSIVRQSNVQNVRSPPSTRDGAGWKGEVEDGNARKIVILVDNRKSIITESWLVSYILSLCLR
jgi:hypothetical protein